jgi:hypothetical protein
VLLKTYPNNQPASEEFIFFFYYSVSSVLISAYHVGVVCFADQESFGFVNRRNISLLGLIYAPQLSSINCQLLIIQR